MNELLITRLRTARINKNMKQQEVADILGIKPNTLSNWEKGRTEPDIDTFVKLCDIYEIDCASLLADVYAFKRVQSDISLSEYEMIKQYRALDPHGKEMVDFTLDREYNRCTSITTPGQVSLFDLVDPKDLEELERVARSPKNNFSDDFMKFFDEFTFERNTIDFPDKNYKNTVQAARNDFESEPGEQEKMQEDIVNLKRPE